MTDSVRRPAASTSFEDHALEPAPDDAYVDAFRRSMPDSYARTFDEEAIALHAGVVLRRGRRAAHVEIWKELPERVVAVCVVAPDRAGLLSRISAAFVAHELDVVAAQAYGRAREDLEGEAVDLFWVRRLSRAGAVLPVRGQDVAQLRETLAALVEGRANVEHAADFARAVQGAGHDTRVRFESDERRGHLVLTVEAADRPGLLFLITEALYAERVQVVRSEVSTKDGKVLDRFRLAELDGAPLKRSRLLGIQTAVLIAIEQSRRGVAPGARK